MKTQRYYESDEGEWLAADVGGPEAGAKRLEVKNRRLRCCGNCGAYSMEAVDPDSSFEVVMWCKAGGGQRNGDDHCRKWREREKQE